MYKNEKVIQLDNLKIESYWDPRKQELNLYAFYHVNGKTFAYKLTQEEVNFALDKDISLVKLPCGSDGLSVLLQKIVDYAYDYFQILPTRFKLESDSQNKHLEDMRKIAFHELGINK